jgi:CDGSH-type Zn-finger protein
MTVMPGDLTYLRTVFSDGLIRGCILKARIGADCGVVPMLGGYVNGPGFMLKWFNTLILEDHETDSLLLIFQRCDVEPMRISDDVEVLMEHKIPASFEIRAKKVWSSHLFEDYDGHDFLAKICALIMEQLSKAMNDDRRADRVGGSHRFLSSRYKEGGMMPVRELRENRDWKREGESELEIKSVHMCRSCGKKSNKGCCTDYHPTNRTKIKMVIGWSAGC